MANYQSAYTGSQIDTAVSKLSDLFNLVYPVGSIYISVNSTSPQTLFGGTWEQIQGKFLLSGSSTYSYGSTGGAANVTLTESQLPSVTGSFRIRQTNTNLANTIDAVSGKFTKTTGDADALTAVTMLSGTTGAGQTITYSFGSGNSHDNMPPYLVVYMWYRTA